MKSASQKLLLLVIFSASLAATLSACAPVVVGGAVMGSLVATDRRTPGTQLEDEGIELHAASRLSQNLGERVHVNITSYNRQVLLSGEVPTAQDKERAGQLVVQVENVRAIVNELAVGSLSTLRERSNDAFITGKVKASMVDAKDLFANAFKVVTERGTTYLMGRVTQREAEHATSLVRSTSGVKKVVRVLEIISEQQLQNMLPKPAPEPVKK